MATGSAATTGTMGDWVKNVFLVNELKMTVLAMVIAAVLAWLVVTQKSPGSRSRLNLPSGPLNLPVVGAIFSMEANIGEWYKKMVKKYGKIFYYRVGSNGLLFVCSSEGAEEVLRTKHLLFANRPTTSFMKSASKYIGFDGATLSFTDYTDEHKNLKKLLSIHVFNLGGLHRFEIFRRREGAFLVVDIQRQMNSEGVGINVDECIFGLAVNLLCSMTFGRRHADSLSSETDQLKHCPDVARRAHTLLLKLNYGDVFPWLAWTNYLGWALTEFKELNQLCRKVLGQSIEDRREERRTRKSSPDRDFLDVLLTLHGDGKISDNGLLASLLDMITGGTECSTVTADWVTRELAKNPACLTKLQKEMDEVVGKERPVEESDFPKLRYLEAVTLESLRLHPPAPLMLPHFLAEATTLQGFDIPPNTTVFVHSGLISRDPLNWEDTEKFSPERFMNSKEKVSVTEGNLFTLLPFGSGRRKCPAARMGLLTVKRIVATLAHAFDWSPLPGKTSDDIDLTEVLTVMSRPATPLWLRAKVRVNLAIYAQALVEQ